MNSNIFGFSEVLNKQAGRITTKEIGHEEPYYDTKISISSFTWAGLAASTKQAQYNEGCSKLNYLLAEV